MALERIKSRSDFVNTSKHGVSAATKGFVLQAISHTDTSSRVGFTASKIIGNAVQRNRAKRRLRALADRYLEKYAMETHDYVFIARKAILQRAFQDLRRDLVYALHNMKLHKDASKRNKDR